MKRIPKVGQTVKLNHSRFGVSARTVQVITEVHEITPEEKEAGAEFDGGYWVRTDKLDAAEWYAIAYFRDAKTGEPFGKDAL